MCNANLCWSCRMEWHGHFLIELAKCCRRRGNFWFFVSKIYVISKNRFLLHERYFDSSNVGLIIWLPV